jgi:hypothetical protein
MCGGTLVWLQTAGWKIPDGPPADSRVRIEAVGNICGSGFARFAHFSPAKEADEILDRDHRAFANQIATLQEHGNQISPDSALVQFNVIPFGGGFLEKQPVKTLPEWQAFWKLDKTDLALTKVRFATELSAEATAFNKLTPQDFRAGAEGPAMASCGADVDLVGPGPGYGRWKKTAGYAEWLK